MKKPGMSCMEIKTLQGVSVEEVTATFNAAFKGYFVPIQLTAEQLLFKIKAEKIDTDMSVGVFENENLLAFILHGIVQVEGTWVAYNAGTGVIPEKRGQYLVQKMYDYITPVLVERKVSQVILEVISENTAAIRSYEKIGFKKVRKLNCYKGYLQTSKPVGDFEVKELKQLPYSAVKSFSDFEPTWQNALHSIEEIKNECLILGAYANDELIAYVIYNKRTAKIHQFAVAEKQRRKGVASWLFSELNKRAPAVCSVLNVDDSANAVNKFLKNRGFKESVTQWEMKWKIS